MNWLHYRRINWIDRKAIHWQYDSEIDFLDNKSKWYTIEIRLDFLSVFPQLSYSSFLLQKIITLIFIFFGGFINRHIFHSICVCIYNFICVCFFFRWYCIVLSIAFLSFSVPALVSLVFSPIISFLWFFHTCTLIPSYCFF